MHHRKCVKSYHLILDKSQVLKGFRTETESGGRLAGPGL